MKKLVTLLQGRKWTCVPKHPEWEQCEFTYACKGWKRARRFAIVRVECKDRESTQLKLLYMKSYDYFCYVVSEDFSPWQTHKKCGEYATSETRIDEAKNQMALSHIKTDSFIANAALFQCAVLAYNTVKWMGCQTSTIFPLSYCLINWGCNPCALGDTNRSSFFNSCSRQTDHQRQTTETEGTKERLYPQQRNCWIEVALG